jgi:hypothetical protein
MFSDEAVQAVTRTFGDNTMSYLGREADDAARAMLESSASSFGVSGQPFVLELGAQTPLDLGGGRETNSFGVLAPVSEATEAAVGAVLLGDQDGAGVAAHFVTNRFFDVDRSRQMKRPVIGYSSGVLATTFLPSRLEPSSCQVAVLDRAGSREEFAEDLAVIRATATGPAGLDKLLPSRDDRISAYADRIVGLSPSGEKVYLGFKVEDRWDAADVAYGGFQGTTYEAVQLTDATPGDETARDLGPRPPTGPELLLLDGFETDDYEIPGTTREAIPTIYYEGSSGQTGYGPASRTVIGFGGCSHYNTRDECVTCCNGNQAAGMATALGAFFACFPTFAAWPPCLVACTIAAGVAEGVFLVGGHICRDNCNARVNW